mmetsp:Transcript_23812/g.71612  ORF Transcript_23812/g.71612 Transcript_23812/m.71612 type:complete len:150 (+) Transcript_23812:381-830(+)
MLPQASRQVALLANILKRLLDDGPPNKLTKFHALKPPKISIEAYLERIETYADCSPSCFVVSLIYIDRLCQGSLMSLSALNIHRVLITAICVASKFLDDSYYSNGFYSQLGGISLEELNNLEVEFLYGLNFMLYVSTNEYQRYCSGMNP